MNQPVVFPDVLAARYASFEMRECWSAETKVGLERDFWLAVMRAQRDTGINIPATAIEAYERVRDHVDLSSIAEREKVLRHDVKARIEEYCELAGHQQIHMGLTSRDLTDNVEQLQILRSLRLIRLKSVAALKRLADFAVKTRELVLVARTHNVPAQLSSMGKRLSMFGEEILMGLEQLDRFIEEYPLRGLQGAVGTKLDQSLLLNGDPEKLQQLGKRIALHLGASRIMNAVGQVYPRSLDMQTVQLLLGLSSGISSFAKTLRLMAGAGLASEGFQRNQVGSSAMPHKQNMRTCERINGFHLILCGYGSMLSGLSGDQWNEGDVSCSVVRRVALPGAFFTSDGQLEAWRNVLQDMSFHEQAIAEEVELNLPFVASTVILMESVSRGGQREDVHAAIRQHTLHFGKEISSKTELRTELAKKLGGDERVPLSKQEINELLDHPEYWLGNAPEQTNRFAETVETWTRRFPETKSMKTESIL